MSIVGRTGRSCTWSSLFSSISTRARLLLLLRTATVAVKVVTCPWRLVVVLWAKPSPPRTHVILAGVKSFRLKSCVCCALPVSAVVCTPTSHWTKMARLTSVAGGPAPPPPITMGNDLQVAWAHPHVGVCLFEIEKILCSQGAWC